MARSLQRTIPERMKDALRRVEGAFSIVAMTRTKLIGVRDPLGVRPLVLGRVGDGYALSSETCALDIIGAEFIREIEPGEMVVISGGKVESHKPFRAQAPALLHLRACLLISRPDSSIGRSLGLRDPRGDRPRTGQGGTRRRRPGLPGAGFGHASGHRLFAGVGHPLCDGDHPKPVTWAAPSSSRPSRSATWVCG